jgi:endonuclease/exonuclease/phosphatase family metal-dependent hydrolase
MSKKSSSFKLMAYNADYFRGIDGSPLNQVLYGYRYLYCPIAAQTACFKAFQEVVEREKPDLCCLVEVDKGSLNDAYADQIRQLEDEEYPYGEEENKYSPAFRLRENPFFVGKSNGFISEKKYKFEKRYLKHGIKQLVYVIELGQGMTLILVHLTPFSEEVRRKQIQEIKEMAAEFSDVIICGDFNILDGLKEVKTLFEDSGLVLMNGPDDRTYPTYRPRYFLDLVICSKNIALRGKLRVLTDCRLSDHLPVVFEVARKPGKTS